MIGSGVLSLACSLTQLGWIGGTLFMVFVAGITYFQSTVLADCYISSDARHPINSTYMDAVREKFGVTAAWVCVCFQQAYIVGTAIAYNITSATSMRVLWKSFGWGSNGITYFLLMFGGAQIFLSQISDFYNNRFLTFLAAIMSIVYTLIGILQSSLKLIANRKTPAGRIRRLSMVSSSQEVWQIAQALGAILFAYPFTTILFEIQDTLKPPENERMKKASAISLSITTVFYILSSCLEYAAFGKDTPGSLLVEFGPDGPNWAVKVANFCIVIHLLGGYQMYSQTVFSCVEGSLRNFFPSNGFINNSHHVNIQFLPPIRTTLLRLSFRTLFVAVTIVVAIIFPEIKIFNGVLGVVGSISFWLLAVYFPVNIYLVQKKVEAWTRKWVVLSSFSCAMFLVCLFTLVGSVAAGL